MDIRTQIAKEFAQVSFDIPWDECIDIEKDAGYRSADFVLNNILGLTPAEIAALADGGHIEVATKDQAGPKWELALRGDVLITAQAAERAMRLAHWMKVVGD